MKLWLLGLLALSLFSPTNVLGQTKDDTLVYALQSDVQNWDPPNSVLRESIILGYNVFDHLAARDLKTGKVDIIKNALPLEGAKADAFWPVYRKYQLDLDKIGDKRLALIKDYAAHYDSMTDAKAKTLATQALDLQIQRTNLLKSYYPQFTKVLGAIDAAKLIQVEHLIMAAIDLQLAAEMPLIEKPAASN